MTRQTEDIRKRKEKDKSLHKEIFLLLKGGHTDTFLLLTEFNKEVMVFDTDRHFFVTQGGFQLTF